MIAPAGLTHVNAVALFVLTGILLCLLVVSRLPRAIGVMRQVRQDYGISLVLRQALALVGQERTVLQITGGRQLRYEPHLQRVVLI